MMSRSNWLILALAVLAGALGGYAARRSPLPATADSSLVGRPSPPLSLPDLDGRQHRLSDYRGRRVLLNFWASWCGPCLDEMPALTRAQAKFGNRGAAIVGIAMDEPGRVRAFLATHRLNYPVWLGRLDEPDSSRQLGDAQGVLPYSVLLGADGRVLAIHVGAVPAAQLEAWLTTPAEHP
ncbi:MAG: TlpA family protein disulfide reductase [Xanthomonadaceae bacterium]|jgi:peroxiredoxin|nr:TlpA family protein disulfide reductase [Xanthomonadaceae bacterium]MDE3072157.1 TlpA family protein disulfide reductase [Pseudomonadota bacterium]